MEMYAKSVRARLAVTKEGKQYCVWSRATYITLHDETMPGFFHNINTISSIHCLYLHTLSLFFNL
jgi:hypothetical protein